jgi:hypothetical protein
MVGGTAVPPTGALAEDFNAAASWRACGFRMRSQICKLASFARPYDVAEVHWTELHEQQRELIRATVRGHINELPRSAWGLA